MSYNYSNINEDTEVQCGTLGASFGKPCASGYVEGILDEYVHSIVRMFITTFGS